MQYTRRPNGLGKLCSVSHHNEAGSAEEVGDRGIQLRSVGTRFLEASVVLSPERSRCFMICGEQCQQLLAELYVVGTLCA